MSAIALGSKSGLGYRRVVWIIGIYAIATLALFPIVSLRGPELPALTPFMLAGILTTEVSTSFLLFVWFTEVRTWSLLLLACAYLYSGSMAIIHLLTFPGAVLPGQILIGGPQSSSLTFLLWTNVFAVLTLASTISEAWCAEHRIACANVSLSVVFGCGASLALAMSSLLVAVLAEDWLPPTIDGSSFTGANQIISCVSLVTLAASVLLVLLVIRSRNVLFLWLSIALTAMLTSNVLALHGGGRYTLGWSIARPVWMFSAGILFLFFMVRFVAQQRSLSLSRNNLEARVNDRTAALSEAVKQRDLLLREVYHRVKNNLQIVDSLLMMESRRLDDPAAREALGELRNRVFTLGLVHQQLMSSNNLETFSIAPFLRELCDNVFASFGEAASDVSMAVNAESVTVDLDFALPVGLLATELLSNAIRHAHAGHVTIEFNRCPGGQVLLVVGDDGKNAEAASARLTSRYTVGSKIIAGLTRQIGGCMNIVNHKGMRIEIRMPLPEAA